MKILNGIENNDGREDLIMKENGVELLIIRQEIYRPYMTYEDIKKPSGLGKFLAAIGLALAMQAEKDS